MRDARISETIHPLTIESKKLVDRQPCPEVSRSISSGRKRPACLYTYTSVALTSKSRTTLFALVPAAAPRMRENGQQDFRAGQTFAGPRGKEITERSRSLRLLRELFFAAGYRRKVSLFSPVLVRAARVRGSDCPANAFRAFAYNKHPREMRARARSDVERFIVIARGHERA